MILGFLFPNPGKDGSFSLSRRDFEEVLEKDGKELKICHKLTTTHTSLPEGAKTSVRIAAQTLSHSVATAIHFLTPQKANQSYIVKCVNDVRN